MRPGGTHRDRPFVYLAGKLKYKIFRDTGYDSGWGLWFRAVAGGKFSFCPEIMLFLGRRYWLVDMLWRFNKSFVWLAALATLAVVLFFCGNNAALAGDALAGDDSLERWYGQDRYETAANMAEQAYQDAEKVIVARGDDYADGLAGSVLAGALDAPILLTRTDQLPEASYKAMENLGAEEIFILGGRAAVSEQVFERLQEMGRTTRIAGDDRYETAVAIAKEAAGATGLAERAFLVDGTAPADAMIVGPKAAADNFAIFQAREGKVPEATREAITELGVNELYAVEGAGHLGDEVTQQLEGKVDQIEKISEEDQYQAGVAVAEKFFDSPDNLIFAGGSETRLADALGGGYLGGRQDAPVLLVDDRVPEEVFDYSRDVAGQDTGATILGGEAALSYRIENEISSALGLDRLDAVLATVGNRKITQKDLNRQIFGWSFEGSIEDPKPVDLEKEKIYLDMLIERKLVSIEAEELGLEVSEEFFEQKARNILGDERFEELPYLPDDERETIEKSMEGRALLKKFEKEALTWKKGDLIVVRFSELLARDSEFDEAGIKEYAEELTKDIYTKIKKGEITVEEGKQKAIDDPVVGIDAFRDTVPIMSRSFDRQDWLSRIVPEQDNLEGMEKGLNEPFVGEASHWIIAYIREKNTGIDDYYRWLEEEEEEKVEIHDPRF